MKKILLIILVVGLFHSCKKEATTTSSEPTSNASKLGTGSCENDKSKLEYLKILTEEMLTTAKHSGNFKKYVYQECAAEHYGDYYVRISDLLSYNSNNGNKFWTSSEAGYIQCLVEKIRTADEDRPEEPILFVPFLEDLNIDSLLADYPTGVPEGVIGDEYDSLTMECPSYTLDNNEDLVKNLDRDEDYAWTHDLWVINQEETVSEASISPLGHGNEFLNRTNGQAEYGGIIKVTDIGSIEPWTSGKVELKLFVFNQSGTKINDIALGKTKRKNVKDTWKDFDIFLHNWTLANIGNYVIESWIEEDGGNSTVTVSSSLAAPCTGCPSTNISFTKQKNDDNMGATIIQFSDAITQEYNISYAKIKHKN